jgi:CubicO group peptidase (beta-lactamase class C family)
VRRLVVLAVVALTLGACSGGGTGKEPSPAAVSVSAERAGRSQAVLDVLLPADEPGCSAAVGIVGEVVWAGAQGVANVRTGAKIQPDTVFDIGSVSKQFTAAAILMLAEAGTLSLDERVSRYVNGLPAWGGRVSIAELVHHTSGIPDYVELLIDRGYGPADRVTQVQAIRAVAAAPQLGFDPGSRWQYSNSNYLLLGQIVERVSGETLPQFLKTRIFAPLDVDMIMDPVSAIPQKAVSYEKHVGGFTVADARWAQVGDGGIQTTPTDLVRWADNYRTGELGGRDLLEEQLAGAVEIEAGEGDRYGAGIVVVKDGSLTHDGHWAGFVTRFEISPDRRRSVAVSCNLSDRQPTAIAEALKLIWD